MLSVIPAGDGGVSMANMGYQMVRRVAFEHLYNNRAVIMRAAAKAIGRVALEAAHRAGGFTVNELQRIWRYIKRNKSHENEEKEYAPPGKGGKRKRVSNFLAPASSSRKGTWGVATGMVSKGKRSASVRSSMRGGKKKKAKRSKKISKQVKRYVKRAISDNILVGKRIQKYMSTGAINSDTMNIAPYTTFSIMTSDLITTYMTSGIKQIHTLDGGTSWTFEDVPFNYDATDRPFTNTLVKFNGVEKFTFKNNDKVKIEMKFYLYLCGDDSTTSVSSRLDTAVDEGGMETGLNNQSPLVFPGHYERFYQRYWKRVKPIRTVELLPGQECVHIVKINTPWFNQAEYEKSTSAIYAAGVTKQLMIRTKGDIVHDSTSNQLVGYSKHQIDYILQRQVRMSLKIVPVRADKITEDLDTITTAVSTNPVNVDQENPI